VALDERTTVLTSPDEVDAFIADHSLAVIFKAGLCHQTAEMFAGIEPLLEGRGDAAFGLIRVVEARATSDYVATRTGVRHESPQLLVFRDGTMVLHRSHREITAEALAAALGARLAAV
jgi:bacillithiol system protein YtxJ